MPYWCFFESKATWMSNLVSDFHHGLPVLISLWTPLLWISKGVSWICSLGLHGLNLKSSHSLLPLYKFGNFLRPLVELSKYWDPKTIRWNSKSFSLQGFPSPKALENLYVLNPIIVRQTVSLLVFKGFQRSSKESSKRSSKIFKRVFKKVFKDVLLIVFIVLMWYI